MTTLGSGSTTLLSVSVTTIFQPGHLCYVVSHEDGSRGSQDGAQAGEVCAHRLASDEEAKMMKSTLPPDGSWQL